MKIWTINLSFFFRKKNVQSISQKIWSEVRWKKKKIRGFFWSNCYLWQKKEDQRLFLVKLLFVTKIQTRKKTCKLSSLVLLRQAGVVRPLPCHIFICTLSSSDLRQAGVVKPLPCHVFICKLSSSDLRQAGVVRHVFICKLSSSDLRKAGVVTHLPWANRKKNWALAVVLGWAGRTPVMFSQLQENMQIEQLSPCLGRLALSRFHFHSCQKKLANWANLGS